jgi:hypothetical protein
MTIGKKQVDTKIPVWKTSGINCGKALVFGQRVECMRPIPRRRAIQ